jgi:hypothetical protein
VEAKERVQLYRVRRDADLAGVKVEERDAGRTRTRAEAHDATHGGHLCTPQRCRAGRASRVG